MPWKRKLSGGTLAFIGFLLSPLSWWNDLFVNVPLALAFAWLVSLFWPAVFGASFVLGYWLTNILGLVLMQKGAQQALSGEPKPYTRRQLAGDIGISLAYTLLIIALVKHGVLKPLPDYLPPRTP
ncbi:MAG: hypothetical protein FD161_814 [Limisphaerales bacterium]|nr:MAG: hypothetical protein FD161_814 [Limisphaerales bacterium]KAG0509973.1 MAG: hypothetical protein E1N63_814 [Limisphaerales bacterium]TXT53137.1 MAG: hypothetical protein FD140_245 [Limisphaerales bacterium]